MTETANIECSFPPLGGHVAAVDYSGCCAIFLDGTLVANGALLWTGQHIVTAASRVAGITSGQYSLITLLFNTTLNFTPPAVTAITSLSYNTTTLYCEDDLAVITLNDVMPTGISRYLTHTSFNGLDKRFTRCVFGRSMDPLTGVKGETYAFSTQSDLYESDGFILYMFSEVRDKSGQYPSKLSFDYDDGTSTRNTIKKKFNSSQASEIYSSAPSVGFPNSDNWGAPAFLEDGLLVGIFVKTYEASGFAYSTSIIGTYGSIGFDTALYYYADFLQQATGSILPNALEAIDIPTFTLKDLSPSVGGASPPGLLRVYYDPQREQLWGYSESDYYHYYSNDNGLSWQKVNVQGDRCSVNAVVTATSLPLALVLDSGRIIQAKDNAIKYSDDNGVSWTSAIDDADLAVTSIYMGEVFRHPVSGVILVRGSKLFTSTDDGETWTKGLAFGGLFYDSVLQVFFAITNTDLYSSNDGIQWNKRFSAAISTSEVSRYGPNLLLGLRYISNDHGITWTDLVNYLGSQTSWTNNAYVQPYDLDGDACIVASRGEKFYYSTNYASFTQHPSKNLSRALTDYIWSESDGVVAVKGNGLYVIADLYYGYMAISEDGSQYEVYNTAVRYYSNFYQKFYFSDTFGVFILLGTFRPILVSDDPRKGWRTYQQMLNGSPAPNWGPLEIDESPNSLLLSYDGFFNVLEAPSSVPYIPVYATKPEPYAASGLIGYTCTKGGSYSQASGTVLQDGLHILTVAHGVYGITSGEYSTFEFFFNVPNGVTITQPTVVDVTIHSSYSPTAQSSGWINYDIAIIHLAEPIDSRVSRYEMFSGTDTVPKVFDKIAYGHGWNPVLGISEADALHFISFQNRYEAYGQSLIPLGYTYIESGKHLLYDYDNGTSARDVIGSVITGVSDLGLGLTEGFTAPGRSGSAAIVSGKIYGITWGNISISPFDINDYEQGTYGEIGVDLRASAFSTWVSTTAVFGVDFESSLPAFTAEIELSEPTGLAISGELSYPIGSLVATEPPLFVVTLILAGLDPDIAITTPLQMDVSLPGVQGITVVEAAGAMSIESPLALLAYDIAVEPGQDFAFENTISALASDISLVIPNRFALQSLMGLSSQIQLKEADQFQWTATIPTLSSLINVETGFACTHIFTGLTGELVAASNSISIGGVLPSLTMAMDLASRQFALESPLSGLKSSIVIGNQQYGIEGYLSSLRGGLTVTDAESFECESTFPGLMFDGLWRSFEISGELAGLRGSIRYDSAMCSTRYL